jgi:hypothetical protein
MFFLPVFVSSEVLSFTMRSDAPAQAFEVVARDKTLGSIIMPWQAFLESYPTIVSSYNHQPVSLHGLQMVTRWDFSDRATRIIFNLSADGRSVGSVRLGINSVLRLDASKDITCTPHSGSFKGIDVSLKDSNFSFSLGGPDWSSTWFGPDLDRSVNQWSNTTASRYSAPSCSVAFSWNFPAGLLLSQTVVLYFWSGKEPTDLEWHSGGGSECTPSPSLSSTIRHSFEFNGIEILGYPSVQMVDDILKI